MFDIVSVRRVLPVPAQGVDGVTASLQFRDEEPSHLACGTEHCVKSQSILPQSSIVGLPS
jgi:hypothetical protein